MIITVDVDAFGEDGNYLIICEPTGVLYSAQAGGMLCTHPEAEGFLIPVWKICPDVDDCENGCQWLYRDSEVKRNLAALISDSLKKFNQEPYGFKLGFDWGRLDELQEGWWPLIITGSMPMIDRGKFQFNHKCYYHGGNCD